MSWLEFYPSKQALPLTVAAISESDIGKRVTIRLYDEPGYRDIVGHLQSLTSLKNRHGQIVQFDPEQIYIWREINDVPRTATSGAPLSIRIRDLELVANETWRAKEEAQFGNWLFRADAGVTRRANSVLILGDDEHIDECIGWYRERNLNPTVTLIPALYEEIDEQLETRGFKKLLDLDVMVKEPFKKEVNFEYEVSDNPSAQWLAVHGDEKIKELLLRSPAKYLSIKDGDYLIAVGRTSFSNGWALISRIWVDEKYRGQGYGRKMLEALEFESSDLKLALQVATTNLSAIKLYESAGYKLHHTGRFRALSQQINLSQECGC